MHELSVALRLIDLADEHRRAAGGGRVAAVTLRIGRLATVDPSALRTAFSMAAEGTPLEAAVLEIVEVPVRIWCPACRCEADLPGLFPLACPTCGAASGDIRAGAELELDSLALAGDQA